MSDPIAEQAARRGVTRLCHLTPFLNLVHITREGGLLSTAELQSKERAAFDPQDLLRLDGHPDHICCSIQYPNVWYLRSRRQNATPLQRLFPAWVCLLIDPSYLWADDALFCHRNAAAGSGSYIAAGADAFAAMYDDVVDGSRGPVHRDHKAESCPTDDQAEVLIPKRIPLDNANHVVVADESQARRIYAGLELIGAPVEKLSWTIAPEFFSIAMSRTLRAGHVPVEIPWDAGVMNAAN